MKQIASNYAYSPATNVVTLTGVNIDADQLLLIVAPGVGRTLYNFASVTGTVVAGTDTRVTLNASTAGLTTTSPLVIFYDDQASAQAVTGTVALDPASLVALENITVTVGSSVALAAGSAQIGSVTVANFPATQTIAGTVTANAVLDFTDGGDNIASDDGGGEPGLGVQLGYYDAAMGEYRLVRPSAGLPVSGTVTASTGIAVGTNLPSGINSGVVPVVILDDEGYSVGDAGRSLKTSVINTVTIGSLPKGALTTRFGSVATANLAFITSAVTNTSRKYLLAQNISAGTVTIGIGFSPTTTQGIQLAAGAGLTFDSFCPTGAVYWLGAVTGAAFTILEG